MEYEIVIKNGKIIDGAGNPWYYGDIGIKDGKIAKVGPVDTSSISKDTQIINASNLIVCPGFIDTHSHADSGLLMDNKMEHLVRQGITTVLGGNCGASLAPLVPEQKEYFMKLAASELGNLGLTVLPWYTFKQYLKVMKRVKSTLNVAYLVGFTTVRASYLKGENRVPTPEELEKMKALVDEAMQAGAFGFSTGLIYAPQMYAKTEEIIKLAKIAGNYKGFYFSHIRNEGNEQIAAINEFIEIVEKSGVYGGQIAHHKIAGEKNWGMSKETLKLIDEANKRGLQIRFDQYPYIRGMNSLADSLPGWVREGDRENIQERLRDPQLREKIKKEMSETPNLWKTLYVASISSDKWKDTEGFSLEESAKKKGFNNPFDLFATLILETNSRIDKISEYGTEEDIRRIMQSKYMMVGTDAGYAKYGEGVTHPRHYGTYPRILGKYVREEKVLRLEDAIRKMTSYPAQTLGLQDRGLVREGMWADLVIFDEKRVIDKATYKNPHQYPEGIEYVLINGKILVELGKFSGELAGHLLTRPW